MTGLTLDQLRTLDAIERRQSFTAAGKELGVATSAVSYAVSSLERVLRLRLFDRTGHRAEMTDEGRRVLESGRGVLERAAELEVLARALKDEWEPRLGVVVDGCLPMRPILAAVRRFSRADLPTHVQLRVEHLGGVRERFASTRADFMLVLDLAGDDRLVTRPLPSVQMRLVAHHTHPLARMRSVDRAELAKHVELVVEDSSKQGAAGRLWLGSPHVMRLSDFAMKRLALLEGVGFGWMPVHLAEADLRARALVPLRFVEGGRHAFAPQLAWRRTVPLGRAARRFLELLAEETIASRAVGGKGVRRGSR